MSMVSHLHRPTIVVREDFVWDSEKNMDYMPGMWIYESNLKQVEMLVIERVGPEA